jgi:Rrf2 family cysteine metabolism transcriptional repressor
MRVSAKGEYAIRAILDLALQRGQGLIPIQDVARRQAIPQRYLEQVLGLLKRAGLVASKRGASGGYQLARSPAEISVGDVLRVVEGRLDARPVGDVSDGSASAQDLAELWREVADAVAAVVDRVTFGDLAERAAARRSPARAVYHI